MFILGQSLVAQEHIGFTHSNFGGVNKIYMNPSYTVGSPLIFDMNIVGLQFYLNNNIAKGGNMSLFTNEEIQFIAKGEPGYKTGTGIKFPLKKFNYVNVEARLLLPSFMLSFKDNGFAFRATKVVHFNAKNLPRPIMQGLLTDDIETAINNREALRERFMVLPFVGQEYAFTYGKTILSHRYYRIRGGVTGKLLMGSYNQSIFKSVNQSRRMGFGLDLGFSYQNERIYKKRGEKHHDQYKWRLDGSINDIGMILNTTLLSAVAEVQSAIVNPAIDIAKLTDPSFQEPEDLAEESGMGFLNEMIEDDPDFKAGATQKIPLFLPTTATLHFDRNIHQRWYFGATFMKSLAFTKLHFTGHNLMSIAGRYQSRFFEFTLPLTFYEYTKPRLGFALKLGTLTFGSDRITGLLMKNSDIYGANFYFSMRAWIKRRTSARDGWLYRLGRKMDKKKVRKRLHITSPKI